MSKVYFTLGKDAKITPEFVREGVIGGLVRLGIVAFTSKEEAVDNLMVSPSEAVVAVLDVSIEEAE